MGIDATSRALPRDNAVLLTARWARGHDFFSKYHYKKSKKEHVGETSIIVEIFMLHRARAQTPDFTVRHLGLVARNQVGDLPVAAYQVYG